MQGIGNRSWLAGVTLALTLVIAGCTAPPRGPAPVEDRGTMTRASGASTAMSGAPGVSPLTVDASGKPLPGIENYGKPGYYAVRPGDTIRRIGNETGQTWQNIVRWNNLENADLIEVGQVLRVIPPGETGGVVARPLVPQPAIVPAVPGTAGASGTAGALAATTPSAPARITASAPVVDAGRIAAQRVPDVTQRLWIAPWVDTDDNFHQPAVVEFVKNKAHWDQSFRVISEGDE